MSGNWTLDGMNVLVDGEYVGSFDSTRRMAEFAGRLGAAIEYRTGEKFPGMYSDESQELYVLGVMKNLCKQGTLIARTDLVRMACRTYRGINALELNRILDRLLSKNYIVHTIRYHDFNTGKKLRRKQNYYALNTLVRPVYEEPDVLVQERLLSDAEAAFEQTLKDARERLES